MNHISHTYKSCITYLLMFKMIKTSATKINKDKAVVWADKRLVEIYNV